ncbi:MAG: hypothetical protein JWQ98_233 [Chlorobi bacterium]|nr:hypothetical protein [Chlorobiota bacterium]
MIIYEVNLDVDNEVATAYAEWLDRHISEVLAIDGFEGAEWLDVESDAPGRTCWSIRYRLKNRASLEDYFQKHAARLRQDGLTRFEGKFIPSRRILSARSSHAR